MRRVSSYTGDAGARTLIQSGLRLTSLSGRCAFSGWRGLGVVSRTVTMGVCLQSVR